MEAAALVIGTLLALYAGIGVVIAVAFVARGVTEVQPLHVTLGARLLLLPAAASLWPLVLRRWIRLRYAK